MRTTQEVLAHANTLSQYLDEAPASLVIERRLIIKFLEDFAHGRVSLEKIRDQYSGLISDPGTYQDTRLMALTNALNIVSRYLRETIESII